MKTIITGVVYLQQGKVCPNAYQNLVVRIVASTLDDEMGLLEVPIQENGYYEAEIEEVPVSNYMLTAKLWLDQGANGMVVDTKGPYCPQDTLFIPFHYNPREHTVLYSEIKSRLKPVLGDGKLFRASSKRAFGSIKV